MCVEFDGLSIGDTARYSTSSDYCIETQLVRMCTEGGGWEGPTPTLSRSEYFCCIHKGENAPPNVTQSACIYMYLCVNYALI